MNEIICGRYNLWKKYSHEVFTTAGEGVEALAGAGGILVG